MNRNGLEPLEDRRLLSTVTLSDSRLTIVGNQNSPNRIVVGYSPGRRYIVAVINGVPHDYKRNDVDDLFIFGGNDADYIAVSEARAPFDRSIHMMGGAGNDTLIGGSENDAIWGDGGDDYISLGAGDDEAFGGSGNDRILGGTATKVIFAGAGDDVVIMGDSHGYIFGNDGNDAILDSSGSRFEIFGDTGNDTITSHGNDTIWGGGGTDVIHGGKQVNQGEFSGINKLMEELTITEPALPAGS